MSGTRFFEWLLEVDERLAAHGFPRLSRFWRRALKKFFEGKCKRFVLRVGRRGGKSLTMAKIAVAVALADGLWNVSPGDVGVIPFLSVDRTEAASRLRSVCSMFDALGIAYARRAEEVELRDRCVLLRVATASTSAVVGFTSIAIFCDEVARWRDVETGANPAREILSSLTPTTATIPSARIAV